MKGDAEVVVVGRALGSTVPAHLGLGASQGSKLAVIVLFTDTSGTLAAIRMAGRLSQGLDARINLVALQVAPYALELTRPAIAVEWLEEQLGALASKVPVDTRVDVILCRDARWALRQVLTPHSLVVIGARHRWWRTKEQRLADELTQDGHQVILTYLQ